MPGSPGSPSRPDLLERLKAADRSLSTERMSRSGSRRVAKRIAGELDSMSRPSRVGWIPMMTFVAGAALVMLFLRWTTRHEEPAVVAEIERPQMSVHVTGAGCNARSGATTTVRGACSIATADPSMTIDTIEASDLELADRVVRVRRGSALFDVDKVEGDPVRVAVPSGEIVVVGTRFRVVVSGEQTEVELYEGRLEFHDHDGGVTPIVAGQVIGFGPERPAPPSSTPRPAEPVEPVEPRLAPQADESKLLPPPKSSQPTKNTRAGKRHDAGPVIEAAERLRREGRYTEAAATLREALRRKWPTRTADVLSYELGRLLERRIKDRTATCEHWRGHLKRFETSRYRAHIERSMAKLACDS